LPVDGPSKRRDIAAFVRRLEDCVAECAEAHPRIALAYSGGLASSLVAMLARKRCDLECFVAGALDSADIRAAWEAARYLDFRIATVVLDASGVERIVRQAKAQGLRRSARTIGPVLPALAVRERTSEEVVLTGFGIRRLHPRVLDSLRRRRIHSPLAEASHGMPLSGETVRAAATSLGLPVEIARVPHRDPADGAGVTVLLQGIELKAESEDTQRSKS
jgi:hypothetical protein